MSPTKTAEPPVETQDDIEVILPDLTVQEPLYVNGVECRVKRLKTLEFLSLMRVLTAGLGPGLGQVRIDFSSPDDVARDMTALLLLALPNASQEFTVFLASIVEPIDGSKAGEVAKYLHGNPDLEPLIDVFERMAVQEKDDLAGLAGKVRAMWKRIADLYSPKTTTGSQS